LFTKFSQEGKYKQAAIYLKQALLTKREMCAKRPNKKQKTSAQKADAKGLK